MKTYAILLLVALYLTSAVDARNKRGGGSGGRGSGGGCNNSPMAACKRYVPQKEWAFAVFVQTWTGTFCDDSCCKATDGVDSHPMTIHGFWPNFKTSEHMGRQNYPSCCKRTDQVTGDEVVKLIAKDSKLQADVNQYWPALKRPGFIEYEWDKHGTCANSVYTNPINFIQAAINLRKKYDFYPVLVEHGINVDGTMENHRSDVRNALEAVTQTTVVMRCRGNQLAEVWTCISREDSTTPTPFDCDDLFVSNAVNCPEMIYLPTPFGASNAAATGRRSSRRPFENNDLEEAINFANAEESETGDSDKSEL